MLRTNEEMPRRLSDAALVYRMNYMAEGNANISQCISPAILEPLRLSLPSNFQTRGRRRSGPRGL
jgi:hypothetical protein